MTDFFKKENDHQASEVLRMKEAYETGGLNRRDFLQGMLSVGLAVTTATTILGASRDAWAETPKRGGRLRVANRQHSPADTLDPVLNNAVIDFMRGRAHLNNLVQFRDDLSLAPDLAQSWEMNKTATEFTFHLQKGVTFHDGKDFTADDVVYSMNRHLGEKSVSKAKTLVNMIKEWKKIDNHTVKAVLHTPNSELPTILGTFHFRIIQDGAEQKEGYFNKIIGTGPFTCEEFTPGVRSVSKRNPNYFREGGPYVDELEIFGITDPVARANALISGEVEIANVDPKAIKQINEAPDAELFSVESGPFTEIVAMTDRHPGDNPDFVMALKYLCDRPRMVRTALKGHGQPGNDHPIAPAYAMHCADLPQRELNHDKAKFHLKKSGITSAQINTSDVSPGAVDMCLLLQAEARKVGLDLDIKRVAVSGYWSAIWGKTPMHVSGWNMRPTANIMLNLLYHSTSGNNESKYSSERLDFLLEGARSETDAAKRLEINCEAQKIISDNAGNIIPMHNNYVDGISTKVRGMPRVPLSAFGGAEFPEFVWLA